MLKNNTIYFQEINFNNYFNSSVRIKLISPNKDSEIGIIKCDVGKQQLINKLFSLRSHHQVIVVLLSFFNLHQTLLTGNGIL